MTCPWRRLIGLVAFGVAIAPLPAAAHAFGARYDLPLPLWLYLTGAGAAVALTFVVLVLFMGPGQGKLARREVQLLVLSPLMRNRVLRSLIAGVGVMVFILILLTGSFGEQSPIHNFAPTMVWVVWWVGFAFFVALAGNVWPALNPWMAVYDGALGLVRMAGGAGSSQGYWRFPATLGVWPSVVLFTAFAWIELVYEGGEKPRTLVGLILGYSVITWAGMIAFGRRSWLTSGEAFHQAFGVLGRFAPIGLNEGQLVVRPYGAGLIASEPAHPSMTVFVLLMLSTVTFDGFVETPVWAGFLDWLVEDQSIRPLLVWLQGAGVDLLAAIKTVALLLFPAAFIVVYLAFCAASAVIAGGSVPTSQLANTLVFSLVPIAIAYHIAHYLSYLLLAGQLIIPLISDPFGWGWDLFGTAGHVMDITVINAATVWYVAIFAIVSGHVIAVWLAHAMALTIYRDARLALRSQIPILVLMVLYTMVSLWILSQPIIAG